MCVRNAVIHDARVRREARALADAGFTVTVVGALRGDAPPREERDGYTIVRVLPRSVLLSLVTKLTLAPRVIDRILKRIVRRLRMLAGAPHDLIVERTMFSGPLEKLRRTLDPLRLALQAHAFQVVAGRAMAALQPAVYHCHDFNTLWAARVARRIHPAPFVYDSHEIYLHQSLPRFTRRRKILVRVVEGFMITRAAAVVAANASYGAHLAAFYDIPMPTVVRNIPDDLSAERTLVQPDAPPTLLYVGGIVRGRGIAQSIRALREIDGARLVCIGPVVREAYREEYEELARSLGLADRVSFEPPVPPHEVVETAARATVGLCLIEDVSLSYRLSLPNKLFECMHAGVPVVGSDFPEIGGLIERYGFGLTCDPADPSAIARAVNQILRNPTLAAEMRERALAAARENTWDAEADVLRDLYRILVTP